VRGLSGIATVANQWTETFLVAPESVGRIADRSAQPRRRSGSPQRWASPAPASPLGTWVCEDNFADWFDPGWDFSVDGSIPAPTGNIKVGPVSQREDGFDSDR